MEFTDSAIAQKLLHSSSMCIIALLANRTFYSMSPDHNQSNVEFECSQYFCN